MKVIQQTFTLLTLRERPVGVWILSGFTAVVGLFIFLSSNPPVDFFGLFCIACADFMIFGSPVKTCLFDKNINRVSFKQKGWLGTQIISYSLDKVAGVQVEKSNLIWIHFYRLSLRLVSGRRFYLTPIPSTDCKLQQSLADNIHEFLG